MKRLALALLIVFGISAVSLAAVENIKISGDITAQAITRDLSLGLTGGAAGGAKDSESFLLSQVRVRFDADLTENVSAVVQFINERLWGSENNSNTDIDLDLAYIVMKNFLYDPLTLTIGRQNLRFGRGLIVGDPDTDNVTANNVGLNGNADDLSLRKSFDAIRATLDFSPLVLDLIYAKITEGQTNQNEDVNLYGVNANYQLSDKTTVEGYVFVRNKDVAVNGDSNDDVYTVGLRGETKVLDDKVNLYGEYAHQFGERRVAAHNGDNHDNVDAWAVQVGADYFFQNKYNAKLGLSYTYLSGDDDSNDNDYEAWNPMFEDQRVGEIANILFDNTNLQYVKLSGSFEPREDITLSADYYYLRLAEKLGTTTYTPNSPVAIANTYSVKSNEKEIGSELDVAMTYDYTEDVQLKLIGGWFFPGDLFEGSNDSTAYSLRASLKVEF